MAYTIAVLKNLQRRCFEKQTPVFHQATCGNKHRFPFQSRPASVRQQEPDQVPSAGKSSARLKIDARYVFGFFSHLFTGCRWTLADSRCTFWKSLLQRSYLESFYQNCRMTYGHRLLAISYVTQNKTEFGLQVCIVNLLIRC